MKRRVCYIWHTALISECDRVPAVQGRASLVHALIEAYGLTKQITMICSLAASHQQLREFHSNLYLKHLKNFDNLEEGNISHQDDGLYGIEYDCPPLPNLYKLVSTIAGGSLTAAKCLYDNIGDVALNWCGGWHHARRSSAAGHCYVNDIVLAIDKLILKFPKVLYVDLDLHHGDGVEDAYSSSKSVFTLSFHKFEYGFYPGTGALEDIGTTDGKGYSCNVPLHEFYSDKTFIYIFNKVFGLVNAAFQPDAIVVQCGGDALAGDPNGGALTALAYSTCVRTVLDELKPTLLLGGGGYNHPNVARLWTVLTAMCVGVELEDEVPEHRQWPQYGPAFTLTIDPALARDNNSKEYIEHCINTIRNNLEKTFGQGKKVICYNTLHTNKSEVIYSNKKPDEEKNENYDEEKDVYDFNDRIGELSMH